MAACRTRTAQGVYVTGSCHDLAGFNSLALLSFRHVVGALLLFVARKRPRARGLCAHLFAWAHSVGLGLAVALMFDAPEFVLAQSGESIVESLAVALSSPFAE